MIGCRAVYRTNTDKKEGAETNISTESTYMSKLKVEFNYSTIASTTQLFNYSGEGRGRS